MNVNIAEYEDDWAIQSLESQTLEEKVIDAIKNHQPVVYGAHFINGKLLLDTEKPFIVFNSFFENRTHKYPQRFVKRFYLTLVPAVLTISFAAISIFTKDEIL